MLIASKSGCISASKLVSETDTAWTLEVENSLHRVSKTDSRQRAFNAMSDALKWAGAEQEMIDHFVALEAEKSDVSNQVHG
jgi:RNA-splicing ligase RtcB